MAEWIDSATLPAESITTSPFLERVGRSVGCGPGDRRSMLLEALDHRSTAYRSDLQSVGPTAPTWLDGDWLAWCVAIIDDLAEAARRS